MSLGCAHLGIVAGTCSTYQASIGVPADRCPRLDWVQFFGRWLARSVFLSTPAFLGGEKVWFWQKITCEYIVKYTKSKCGLLGCALLQTWTRIDVRFGPADVLWGTRTRAWKKKVGLLEPDSHSFLFFFCFFLIALNPLFFFFWTPFFVHQLPLLLSTTRPRRAGHGTCFVQSPLCFCGRCCAGYYFGSWSLLLHTPEIQHLAWWQTWRWWQSWWCWGKNGDGGDYADYCNNWQLTWCWLVAMIMIMNFWIVNGLWLYY